MTDSPDDRGIRELCEKHGLMWANFHDQGLDKPLAGVVDALREAIQIVKERAAELAEASVTMRITPGQKVVTLSPNGTPLPMAIRALVFTEEDARLSTKQ